MTETSVVPPRLGLQSGILMPGILCRFWGNLNSVPQADAADTLLRVVSLAPFLCVLCVWVHGCMEARAGVSLLGSLIFALLPGGTVSHRTGSSQIWLGWLQGHQALRILLFHPHLHPVLWLQVLTCRYAQIRTQVLMQSMCPSPSMPALRPASSCAAFDSYTGQETGDQQSCFPSGL